MDNYFTLKEHVKSMLTEKARLKLWPFLRIAKLCTMCIDFLLFVSLLVLPAPAPAKNTSKNLPTPAEILK